MGCHGNDIFLSAPGFFQWLVPRFSQMWGIQSFIPRCVKKWTQPWRFSQPQVGPQKLVKSLDTLNPIHIATFHGKNQVMEVGNGWKSWTGSTAICWVPHNHRAKNYVKVPKARIVLLEKWDRFAEVFIRRFRMANSLITKLIKHHPKVMVT